MAMHLNNNCEPTTRELEVMDLLYEGHSNKVTAERLGITLRTVEHHLETAYQKLNAHGRADAVVKALKVGWITLEDSSDT